MAAGTVMFTDSRCAAPGCRPGTREPPTTSPSRPGSMIVSCRDQEEIDRYWTGLSAVPEAERCGWCVDRWGVSWRGPSPTTSAELMADAATRDNILHMGKIDLAKL